MLLAKLQRYPGIMTWVNRAESKEGDSYPAFEVSFGLPPLSRERFLQEFYAKTGGVNPRTVECRPQGVWVVSLAHKGADEERVAALHNRRLEEGRMITALHTVRPLTAARIFEVVLKELNDRQRYVDRDASVSGSTTTPGPTAPRYPARNMRAVQADEASHSDSDLSGNGKVTPKSVPKSHTPPTHSGRAQEEERVEGARTRHPKGEWCLCPPPPPPIVCWNCKESGHMQRECSQPRRPLVCLRCNKEGHFARECPDTPPAGFKGGKGRSPSQAEGKGKGKGSQSYSFSGPFPPTPPLM